MKPPTQSLQIQTKTISFTGYLYPELVNEIVC